MPAVGILTLLVIGGAVLCVKARAAGPAAVCSGLAVLFVVSTPLGSGVPSVVATLFSVLDSVTSPALNHQIGTPVDVGSAETTTVGTESVVNR